MAAPIGRPIRADRLARMPQWEYSTVPLIVHATKQILDQWGEDGWELVQVVPAPTGESLVAYLKRPKA
jgi:hypothetical protein